MIPVEVAIVNHYAPLSNAEVEAVVAALQVQVYRDFYPIWGIDANLTFYPDPTKVPLTAWLLSILDNADQAGDLGYHDVTAQGLPLGKIYAGSDAKYGSSWSVTASHELLEMLADPAINLTVARDNADGSTTFYAYENCDACEDDQWGYLIGEILVSDFVYPSWFEDFHPVGTQYDHCKKIQAPFHLLTGGYIGIYKPASGWTQMTAGDFLYKMRAPIGSRRERRRLPKHQWQRSRGVVV